MSVKKKKASIVYGEVFFFGAMKTRKPRRPLQAKKATCYSVIHIFHLRGGAFPQFVYYAHTYKKS